MANVYTPIDSSYKLVFDDEFNGTSVNTSKWVVDNGTHMNNVTTSPSNVMEANGDLTLTLASATSGAEVQTPDNTGFTVAVGDYVEARVYFSGNGSQLYNWPAWWISGPNWPAAGENDIAEVLGGNLTVNYHSPSGSHNQGTVPGYWGDNFHVYGLMRNASSVDVYWDGKLVKSYPTDDNGVGEQPIFNIGSGQGSPVAYGAASQLKVDYIHVSSNASDAVAVTPDAGYGGPGDTGGGGTPPPPPPPPTPSPSGTEITKATDAAIIDGSGNAWSLVQSANVGLQVAVNGTVDSMTSNVVLLETLDGSMVQENSSGNWYSESLPNDSWVQISNPNPPPPPSVGTLALAISEDYYKGDAQFTVSVDGKQVGGTQTAHVLHSTGDDGVFLPTGNWDPAVKHDVKITFINDAYGGTASTDRNLYVDSISLNGTTYSGTSATMLSNGSHDFAVGGTVPTAPAKPDTLTLHLSEDAYKGDAQFKVSVDGKTLDTSELVNVLHSSGGFEDFTYTGNFGPGQHDVGVTFLNDAYGGTASTDRNLYVNSVAYDSHTYAGATLFSAGTAHFSVSA